MKLLIRTLIPLILLLLSGCTPGQNEITPPEIQYGEDICVECMMIISDVRFAAGYAYEVAPNRYESLAFDDIGDMLMHADKHPEHDVVAWYVHDYNSQEWLDAAESHFVFSNHLHTPMGQGTAAHSTLQAAEGMASELNGEVLDWVGLRARHNSGSLVVDALSAESAATSEQPVHDPADHESMSEMDHETTQEIILGEADIERYHLQLATLVALHTGFNNILLHLTDPSGHPVEDAVITYMPLMEMAGGDQHSAGVEQPVVQMPGMYRGAVAFPMPSGPELGTWTLTVHFEEAGAGSGDAIFEVNVAPSQLAGSFIAPDERKIFLMAVQPVAPLVGVQPFEVFAMQKIGMFDWPPLDDLTLEIKPWMPTMDHGSLKNVNPASQGNGHYLGEVNFAMNGSWTVTVTATDGKTTLGDVVFEYDIP